MDKETLSSKACNGRVIHNEEFFMRVDSGGLPTFCGFLKVLDGLGLNFAGVREELATLVPEHVLRKLGLSDKEAERGESFILYE